MIKRIDFSRRDTLGFLGTGLFVSPAVAALAGCSLPGSSPPPQLFTLSPKSTFPSDLPVTRSQLVVDVPFAAAGLDTARIALAPDEFRIEYFADSAWSDRAPAMVQSLIVESFENTGNIVAISRESVDLRPDFILKTEMREFQAVLRGEDTPPDVLVQLNAKIVVMPQRLIFANNTFESRASANTRDLEAVVQAFDDALGNVLKDLVAWTLQTLPESTSSVPFS